MVKLEKSIKHWKSEKFSSVFKMELMQLGVNKLPLQKAASPGKFVHDSDIGITILATHENELDIEVKVGITFSEVQCVLIRLAPKATTCRVSPLP